jgi:serine/threonine protein kinase
MESKYKIIEIISNGAYATIYKIQIGKKYYALRSQKIFKSEAIEYKKIFENKNILDYTTMNTKLYRLICFNKFINTINKNHFAILYKYKINKCNFTQPLTNFVKNNSYLFNRYNELQKSNFCLDIIMDLKDGPLRDIMSKLSKNQIYSLIIQIIYTLYLMHINGFYHCDVHDENIMYTKTSLKTIKIFDLIIPTFGYIYSIIDYEEVASTKFKSSCQNEEIFLINHKYKDNMIFLCRCIFQFGLADTVINNIPIIFVNKIINNEKISMDNQKIFDYTPLNYEDTVNYIKYINDEPKLIKYFYKKIKS